MNAMNKDHNPYAADFLNLVQEEREEYKRMNVLLYLLKIYGSKICQNIILI